MKLKILIFCLLTAIVNVSVAQNGNNKILIPAGVGDKAGFIDLKGKWVVKPQFDKVEVFGEFDLAGVELSGKWGFIDKTGKMVIEPKYDEVAEFGKFDLAGVKLSGKWGFIDKTGKIVIEPKYDEITWDNTVRISGNYYYIDKDGNEVEYWKDLDYGKDDGREKIAVKIGEQDNDLGYGFHICQKYDEASYIYGVVDKSGKMIIEPRFLKIGAFSNGLAPVKSNGTWDSDIYCGYGYIDTTGKMTIAAIYDYAESFTQNGLARVEIRGKWGLIDTAGKNVIEPQFAYAFPLHRGYSILSDSINWDDYYTHIFGNVDSTGKIYEFDNKYELSDFNSIYCEDETDDELFGVKFNEKWGFIDNKGMIVIRPQFDNIGSDRFYTSEPLMAAEINGKWGFIDKTGKMVIEPQFDEAYAFDYFSYYGLDLAIVSIGDNKYLIDKSGKIFSSELQQFYGLYHLINGIIITRIISDDRKSQEWRYISKKGKHIKIPTQNIDWLVYESTNNLPDY